MRGAVFNLKDNNKPGQCLADHSKAMLAKLPVLIFLLVSSCLAGLVATQCDLFHSGLPCWQKIGSLNTGRGYSPITLLGEKLVVSSGAPSPLTSIETWNGSSWIELDNLMVAREYHAAASIKARKLSCV